jgi:hypothetical protein
VEPGREAAGGCGVGASGPYGFAGGAGSWHRAWAAISSGGGSFFRKRLRAASASTASRPLRSRTRRRRRERALRRRRRVPDRDQACEGGCRPHATRVRERAGGAHIAAAGSPDCLKPGAVTTDECRRRPCGSGFDLISSERMAHLPQDRGEIVDDLPAERCRQIAPDVARLDGRAPWLPSATATSNLQLSMLSLVPAVCCSLCDPRFVAVRGRSNVRPNRNSTRAQDSEHVPRAMETRRKRRP